MKTLAFVTLCSLSLWATSIEQVVQNTLRNNPTLQKYSLSTSKLLLQAKKDTIWSDPVISIGITDIQANRPFKRGFEPMQTEFITISQVIPRGNKLELKGQISYKSALIEKLKQQERKRVLKSQVLDLSYRYLTLKKKIELLEQKQTLLKKEQATLQYLYENSRTNQMMQITTSQKLSTLKIKLEQLHFHKKKLLLAINKLSFSHIKDIQGSLKLKAIKINSKRAINSHPTIKIIRALIAKAKIKQNLEIANKKSDIKLTAGYYHRKGYNDYVSLSLSMPLKVSEREELALKQALLDEKMLRLDLKNTKWAMQKDIKNLLNWLHSSQKNIATTQKELLVSNKEKKRLLNFEQENASASTLKIIQNKIKAIDLKLLILQEKELFFQALAKLIYYKG